LTRILITGASGFLGHNLAGSLVSRHEVFAGYHSHFPTADHAQPEYLDITVQAEVEAVIDRTKPQIVVHSAALSQPDECERNPAHARRVIIDGSRNIARTCLKSGSRLIHISTDLVFDGEKGYYTEKDPVRGLSVYSAAKIAAENLIRRMIPSAVILRIAVLYGAGSPSSPGFLETILRAWRAGSPMRFYTDQYRTPVFAPEVARAIEAIDLRPEVRGIFHMGGADRLSRHEFALMVADRVKVPREQAMPGSMSDSGGRARRGADCSLVADKLRRALGIAPLPCSEGLDALVRRGYLVL
jgi:dTDP-4-dehydrorhamnose reductase